VIALTGTDTDGWPMVACRPAPAPVDEAAWDDGAFVVDWRAPCVPPAAAVGELDDVDGLLLEDALLEDVLLDDVLLDDVLLDDVLLDDVEPEVPEDEPWHRPLAWPWPWPAGWQDDGLLAREVVAVSAPSNIVDAAMNARVSRTSCGRWDSRVVMLMWV
jgi:hypothetical protein